MSEAKKVSENRVLAMVLAVMCVAIVVLVGFVVVGMNRGGEEVEVISEAVTESGSDVSEAELAAQHEFEDSYDEAVSRVQEMLDQDPVDAAALMSLCDEQINRYINEGRLDYAASYVWMENRSLTSRGLNAEALEALLKVNHGAFGEVEQYRQYSTILSLATKLGRDDIIREYEPLAAGTKAAWDANVAGAEAAAENVRARKANLEGSE